MPKPQCLLDMDGVLADFVSGACEVHDKDPYPPPNHLGEFDMEKVWGITPRQFWQPINDSPYFWELLPRMDDARAIVKLATKVFGEENIAILTAPSHEASCFIGKRKWIEKQFPQFKQRILFGSAKQFCAAPNCYLLDDRDRNVDAFNEAGGIGVLVPRLWNSMHPYAGCVMEVLEEDLENVGE